jgi:hypothetical protein
MSACDRATILCSCISRCEPPYAAIFREKIGSQKRRLVTNLRTGAGDRRLALRVIDPS